MTTLDTRKIVRIDLPEGAHAPALQEERPESGATPTFYHSTNITFGSKKFPVWEVDAITAGVNVRMKNRYKLFQSEPLSVQIISPSGSIESETVYPWTPIVKHVPRIDEKTGDQVVDPENGELVSDPVIEWVEDRECQTAQLSQAAKSVSGDIVPEAVLKELEVIKAQIATRDKRLDSLSSAVIQKDATIRKLKEEVATLKAKKAAPAVESKGE
jgi:uncharacterized coiled-coil protein SlyX